MTSNRMRRLAIGLGVIPIIGAVVLFGIVQREPERARRLETTVGLPAPVVVVPGYNGTTDTVSAIAARLRAEGRMVVPVRLPDLGRGSIARSAAYLRTVVEDLGSSPVDIVGFSAGGVVVRAFLGANADRLPVRRVVLLGAPNHGAQIASVAAELNPSLCTGACRQLRPGSAFLSELNSGDETPGDPQYTSIWTERDQLVTPPDSARLEGARNVSLQDACANARAGHGELLFDPLALGLMARALNGTLPDGVAGACEELRKEEGS
ncbi:MAG: lipase [Actinobacteria bacterium]|nr:lipase [Actinomycetota bacterium]